MAKYVMNHLEQLQGNLQGRKISLFLDYDGTLAPIVGRPEKAELPLFMRDTLRSLTHHYPVAVISGRSLKDLKERINLDKIVYAGNHGIEIWSKDFKLEMVDISIVETLKRITDELEDSLVHINGVLIENKRLTASVHYRIADLMDVKPAMRIVKTAVSPYIEKGIFVLREGKKVLEIRPNIRWNKGNAVEWILGKNGFKNTMPIYIGDDETDRDAFNVLKGKGISVGVGYQWQDSDSDSDYFLKTQAEVKRFLEWLN